MSHRVPEPSRGTFSSLRARQTSHRLVNDIVYHSTPELEAMKIEPPPRMPFRWWECVRVAGFAMCALVPPPAKIGEWIMLGVFCVLAAAMIAAFIVAA